MREVSDEDKDRNIAMHAEGGYFHGMATGVSLYDSDSAVAASIAISEGHLGDGVGLFAPDGSLVNVPAQGSQPSGHNGAAPHTAVSSLDDPDHSVPFEDDDDGMLG